MTQVSRPATGDRAADWSKTLGNTFIGLAPGGVGEHAATGAMSGASFGSLSTYGMSGSAQTMRRTPQAVPPDRLAIGIVLDGHGLVSQNDHQAWLRPGQMGILDDRRPFELVLHQPWSIVLILFARDALSLPQQVIERSLLRTYTADEGPGAVLADFISSAMRQGATPDAAAGRIGEAGLHLIAATLGAELPENDTAADAQRIRVLHYVRTHLADPELSHEQVAAAQHMSPRTLHRLFAHEPYTVTEYIRVQRLEAVRRDLTDPMFARRSIAGVAARWGFTSAAYFTRAFQAQYGVAPSTVRKALDDRGTAPAGGSGRPADHRVPAAGARA